MHMYEHEFKYYKIDNLRKKDETLITYNQAYFIQYTNYNFRTKRPKVFIRITD
jgi:hypothetical protein